jgi:aryl-alcohol dehydrogenase-like predicted oxidoreductase
MSGSSSRIPVLSSVFSVSSFSRREILKYVLSHPAVTCAIPGSTQVAHVEDNLGAARGRLPDATMRQTIARYFDSIADR